MTPRSRRQPLARRTATALAALTAVAMATLTLTAVPALADSCPNATVREQNNSTQLPDCRAYELVNSAFKEGFVAYPQAFTDDGRLAYKSNGNIAGNGLGAPGNPGGNEYIAVRSASGWSTTALAPSGPVYNLGTLNSLAQAFSSDLRSSLWVMSRAAEPTGVGDLYVRRPDGTFTRIGPTANPATILPSAPGGGAVTKLVQQIGASDDLSHIVFALRGEDVYPGIDPGPEFNLYESVGTGDQRPRPVGVDNAGQQIDPGCESVSGGRAESTYRAMSTDGRVIFFSTCNPLNPRPGGMPDPTHLWARINGTTTIAVSASQCTRAPSDPGGACDGAATAVFAGSNADGTRVYFTTSQQLVNGDTDSTQDLYECEIPSGTPAPDGLTNRCPSLREVSGAATGADVQGVTRLSDDGSRAYFVATGVLASNTGANDVPALAGDDNLYVWQRDAAHPSGNTKFVGKLDAGDGNLWASDQTGRLAQTSDDGRYLVFASYASLIDHGPQRDTDTARDVYRYDADAEAMTRISTDEVGDGGNAPGQDAQFTANLYRVPRPTDGPRGAMSDDGQTVVFYTGEALSSSDTNGIVDVYMWHDGRVSLISSGGASLDSTVASIFGISAWISSSGRDLFFMTSAQLLPADVDSQVDIYDARVDGGFDLSTPPPCSGDGCQGGRSAPPPALQSGSSSSTGQDGSLQVTPAFSVRALTAAQRKRVASTGKVSLSVTTNTAGTLTASASATIAKRPNTVGSAKRKVAKAGTVPLSLTLSKKARAELKGKGKLTVKVLVRQDNVAISRTVSVKLTRTRTAEKKTSRHTVVQGGRS